MSRCRTSEPSSATIGSATRNVSVRRANAYCRLRRRTVRGLNTRRTATA